MTFTKTTPTKPGFYAYKFGEDGSIIVMEVFKETDGSLYCYGRGAGYPIPTNHSILWCHLVPAELVESAYKEAVHDINCAISYEQCNELWQSSRARKVIEGETE